MATFEQGPALWVPLRFLLTAPLFGVAAGLTLAWLGADALASRWNSSAVALTHLLTAGYLLQAMSGALLQFVPVAAGGNVWRPRILAAVVHPLTAAGAALLCASFLGGRTEGLWLASALLAAGCGSFAIAVGTALLRSSAASATARALRASIGSLVVTVALGVALVQTLSGRLTLGFVETANLHALWGLGGWSLLLLAGVSMYVVPMFQLTPFYPAWLAAVLSPGLLAVLLVMSINATMAGGPGWRAGAAVGGIVLATLFAATTLWLQEHRRRARTDATFHFFRNAMYCLLAAASLSVLLWIPGGMGDAVETPLGVLILVGVFVTAINGMLYKIVPFLCSLQLQRSGRLPLGRAGALRFIAAPAMTGQRWLHLAALVLLLGAPWLPRLAGPAGVIFAASCAWLEYNLVAAVLRYRALKGPVPAGAEAGGS